MAWLSLPVFVVLAGIHFQGLLNPSSVLVQAQAQAQAQVVPPQAQVVDQTTFNVLPNVLPSTEVNGTQIFMPPGLNPEALLDKPFHIYDDEFYSILGSSPTLTLIAESETDPLFHEAVVWYEPTDEVFFVQNAGAPAAGTGLNKSAIIQKISLAQAGAVSNLTNATGMVTVTTVPSDPTVVNPNGKPRCPLPKTMTC